MESKVLLRKVSMFMLLLAAAVFTFTPLAEAARQTFGPISVEVPRGWQVTEEDDQLTFTAPENAAVVSIIVDTLDGATLKDIAEGTAQALGGSAPVVDADGDFSFTFKNEHGVDGFVLVTGDEADDFFVVLVVVGEHPDTAGLLNSIQVVE